MKTWKFGTVIGFSVFIGAILIETFVFGRNIEQSPPSFFFLLALTLVIAFYSIFKVRKDEEVKEIE